MTTPTITLTMVNLQGYTLDNQQFIVTGNLAAFRFLKSILKHLDDSTFGWLIENRRIAKFEEYCNAHGVKVQIKH